MNLILEGSRYYRDIEAQHGTTQGIADSVNRNVRLYLDARHNTIKEAKRLIEQGVANFKQENWALAGQAFDRAIERLSFFCRDDHLLLATAFYNRGSAFARQELMEQAIDCNRRCLAIRANLLSADDSDLIKVREKINELELRQVNRNRI
jgi:tetratricopeptide (TPR) repeat protein